MIFRRKLLAVFALTVFLVVGAVTLLVSALTRRAFEQTENVRTAALVTQFQREFERQGEEAARRVEAVAVAEPINRLALMLNQGATDTAGYFDLAKVLSENHQLDFLEIVDNRGVIISSAQWPAKFGYPDTAFEALASSTNQSAFLKQEELQDSTALGLFAVRASRVGDRPVYVIGGRRLDKSFLAALNLSADMRTLLYQNRGERFQPELLIDPESTGVTNTGVADTRVANTGAANAMRDAEKLSPLIDAVRSNQEMTSVVHWSPDQADDEVFHAIPLRGAGKDRPLLGILLVGNSLRSYVNLKRNIRSSALWVGSAGIILAILLSSWAAARATRPVVELANAAREVAAGNWNTKVEVSGNDEMAELAASFNRMTTELLAQRDRLVQAERVAAWRELARRLAHELKNPLFPLQLTVENLVRARQQTPAQFDEVFRESTATLISELTNLKGIIGRFSEFSKMPHPQLQPVDINEVVRGVAQLYQAQLQAPERPAVTCRIELDKGLAPIAADAELLHRAVSNLVLNAMDALPNGGVLTLRTRSRDGKVIIEVSDNGSGLTPEECERIFTPYYTSKQHGTGLGLAIVQSVVSDHGGSISVHSNPGQGTTFVIELPQDGQALKHADDPARSS